MTNPMNRVAMQRIANIHIFIEQTQRYHDDFYLTEFDHRMLHSYNP